MERSGILNIKMSEWKFVIRIGKVADGTDVYSVCR